MPSRDDPLRGSPSHLYGDLESPYLEEEYFVEDIEAEWETRFTVLQTESPFDYAFDKMLRTVIEPELYDAEAGKETEEAESFEQAGEPQEWEFGEPEQAFELPYADEVAPDFEEEELWHELEEEAEENDIAPGQEQETAEKLRKKLNHLSFLPHSVEENGKDVPLTPGVMDPKIYDGPIKYKIASKLQECLMGVMKEKKGLRHIKVALVDLTKGFTQPELAAFEHKDQVFAASVPKIAAMLAAFQLRQDLRAALKQKKVPSIDKLFDLVRDDWADTQRDSKDKATPFTAGVSLRGKLVLVRGNRVAIREPKAPRLDQVFADVPAGNALTIEFRSTGEDKSRLKTIIKEFNNGKKGAKQNLDALGFLERMRVMIGGMVPASNYATSTIVRDVGFLYIASTLLQSGLYNTDRSGGLWLGADYRSTVWRGALAGGASQSATAGSLAAFMTLLAQNRLVSPQASGEMSGLMKKEPNPTHPGIVSWFKEGLKQLPDQGSLRLVLSKLGVHSGIDDCAFIEREVDANGGKKTLRYVAVGLRAKSSAELQNLILELDKCILANNGLTPEQGGHSKLEKYFEAGPERMVTDLVDDGREELVAEMELEYLDEQDEDPQEQEEFWQETLAEDEALGWREETLSGEADEEEPEYRILAEELFESLGIELEELTEREDWEPQKENGKMLYEKATLTAPDRDEKKLSITVNAFRFPGISKKVALVFAGVHGTELQGVTVANKIVEELRKAARIGKQPQFTTIVISELIRARRSKDDPRYVLVGGKQIEPNRNFPRPGESYAEIRSRGQTRNDTAELLDRCGRPLAGPFLTHRMLAENRILVQLIEREKPVRAASIHAHSVPGRRGDGPGIFVDPRGDFDECSDQAKTKEGTDDDKFASSMMLTAMAKLKKPLKDNGGKRLSHPFHGNLADHFTNTVPDKPSLTVHYTATSHPPGTSFGMWAPAKGVTTITVELPRYKGASKALANLTDVYVEVLLNTFLGGLSSP